jgi:thiol-disulfide isomerase/thioredoxin
MNRLLNIRFLCQALVWLAGAQCVVGRAISAELHVFETDSFAQIREAGTGSPLIVAFWSTTCAPCAEEMRMLAELHRQYPAVRMAMVAADTPELRPKVERFLARYDLRGIELWQFGDEAEERLRYAVDPKWRGELPRAYFFDGKSRMIVQSGVPDHEWLRAWFARESASPETNPSNPGPKQKPTTSNP